MRNRCSSIAYGTLLGITLVTGSIQARQTGPAAPPQQEPRPTPTPEPTPKPTPVAVPTGPNTVANPVQEPKGDPVGYLTFYRKKRFAGAMLNTSVHVDDVEIADLDNGTYVTVKLPPGEHKLYADEKKDAILFKVEAGKISYFRMEFVVGFWKGHGKLKPMDEAEGAKEFAEWKPKLAPDIRKPEMVVKPTEKLPEKAPVKDAEKLPEKTPSENLPEKAPVKDAEQPPEKTPLEKPAERGAEEKAPTS